jgi:hypothetical protein
MSTALDQLATPSIKYNFNSSVRRDIIFPNYTNSILNECKTAVLKHIMLFLENARNIFNLGSRFTMAVVVINANMSLSERY